ncbi:MAG: hypothetical protein LBH05_02390 [Deferribacteraceae bacterium]|jgi:hypothetical protein|nr:hypothetical protein [Deferribacteraceae bacterium]
MKNTLKLPGIIAIAITVLVCAPKLPAEIVSGEYFTVEIFTAETDTIPEYALDSGGEWLIFRTSRQLKDISFISVGFGDNNNFYQDDVLLSLNDLSIFIIRSYLSETIPSRGVSFTDDNGNRKFFYIAQSGMDGSVCLKEFQNNPPAQAASVAYTGSFGPAGGIIFYAKDNNEGGWRYLETVPDGYEFNAIWGLGYQVLDGLSAAIGTGKRNIEIIVRALKSAKNNTDKFDYYERYYYVAYWSSSDDSDESTWFYNFDDGTQDAVHADRDMAEYIVFTVRAFR